MDFSAVLATKAATSVDSSAKASAKTKSSSDSSYGSVMKQSMKSSEQKISQKNDQKKVEETETAVSEFILDLKDVLKDTKLPSTKLGQETTGQNPIFAESGVALEALLLGMIGEKIPSDVEPVESQTIQAWLESINEVVATLMATIQSLITQGQQADGNNADQEINLQLDQTAINQLFGLMSKEQLNDLSKVLAQLQNMLAQQSDLSKLDIKVLTLLNQFNVFKEQNLMLQSNQSQIALQQQGAKDNIISFAQMAQSSLNNEQSSTQGEQAKQPEQTKQPFLLRTDMTKVMWQSEMSKTQQLSLNVEMKGTQVNTESLMKGLDKMLSSSAFLKNGAMSKLVIKLNPESLGTIRIELIQSQNSLIAKLHVQNEQVRSLIESQLSSLKQSFTAQNVQVDRFEISSNIDFDKYQRQFQQGNFGQSKGEQKDSTEQSEENQNAEEVNFKSKLEEIQQILGEESI